MNRALLYAEGEPNFGSIWGADEEAAMLRAARLLPQNGPHKRIEQAAFEEAASVILSQAPGGPLGTVSVNSCGTALDIVLDYLALGPGDEVVTAAPNFFGVHLAILRRGATIVFADSEPGGINLDPVAAGAAVTARTRAVLATHMNGIPVQRARLELEVVRAAERLAIPKPVIIEDAARAMGAQLETAADTVRLYSLHRKKMISTLGEGGLIQTTRPDLLEFARMSRSYGLGVGFGSSLRMTEPQAAVGSVQLSRLGRLVARRRELVDRRMELIREAGLASILMTVRRPGDAPYMHTLLLGRELAARREILRVRLREVGIGSVFGAYPTYASHRVISERVGNFVLPNTEDLAKRVLCVAVHPAMDDEDEALFTAALEQATRATLWNT